MKLFRFLPVVLCAFLLTVQVLAMRVQVGLFTDATHATYTVTARYGSCEVRSRNGMLLRLEENQEVTLEAVSGNVRVKSDGRVYGVFAMVRVHPSAATHQALVADGRFSTGCHDDVIFKVKEVGLLAINVVELEEYVASVVESEIMSGETPEMIKVQAILIRTYVIGNLQRHAKDGFDLCDRVHCQVFNGRDRYQENVRKTVRTNQGKVLVGEDGKLILAVYHSNCGGQTSRASDTWSEEVPALQSVVDTFCRSSKHANWSKVLTRSRWEQYLSSKGIDCNDSMVACYDTDSDSLDRICCIMDLQKKVVRKDLDLPSAFFSVTLQDEYAVIAGRGFGHGVGLCQEGASVMAASGVSADDILMYYYCGTKVVKYKPDRKR